MRLDFFLNPSRRSETRTFVEGMTEGQETSINLDKGKTLYVKLKHISDTNDMGTRDVTFEMNGVHRIVKVMQWMDTLIRDWRFECLRMECYLVSTCGLFISCFVD